MLTIKKLNRKNTGLENKLPIKIVQFGEGNFLRAFVDYAFQVLNESTDFNGGIAVVQPIKNGMVSLLENQDGLYTLFMNGVEKEKIVQEKKLVTTIVKTSDPYKNFSQFLKLAQEEELQYVISNTTESGIEYLEEDHFDLEPPLSFPGKLTRFLFERYLYFSGDPSKGLAIIPCELINYNGDTLREVILKYIELWKLEPDFKLWIEKNNSFHNSLVDRIVPGYPKDELSKYQGQLEYEDQLMVTAETFFLWVIEGDTRLKTALPFHKTKLDVKIITDMQPYRTRKVRILNGAHTAMVPLSILHGHTTVKESVEDPFTGTFIHNAVYDEIIDTLSMDRSELVRFADEVMDRFKNPFIIHQLSTIALNSISKFKVRVLPSLIEYANKNNKLPIHLTFSLACLIVFYRGTWNGKPLPLNDNEAIIQSFEKIWDNKNYAIVAKKVLENADFWDQDLTKIPDLTEAIALALETIEKNGIEKGFAIFNRLY